MTERARNPRASPLPVQYQSLNGQRVRVSLAYFHTKSANFRNVSLSLAIAAVHSTQSLFV